MTRVPEDLADYGPKKLASFMQHLEEDGHISLNEKKNGETLILAETPYGQDCLDIIYGETK